MEKILKFMVMKKIAFFIISLIIFASACDLYPDWKSYVKYSSVYPVCGEYYVRDFDPNTDTLVTDWYKLYIYNTSYNPTGDSVWVDNYSGHPATGQTVYPYRFKIRTKADTINLTFDANMVGSVQPNRAYPLDSCSYVTIKNSKIWHYAQDIDDFNAQTDSIYFEFEFYDYQGNLVRSLAVKGHRKTGWENPNYEDHM